MTSLTECPFPSVDQLAAPSQPTFGAPSVDPADFLRQTENHRRNADGYLAGHAEGLEEGRKAAIEAYGQATAALHAAVAQLHAADLATVESLSHEAVALAMSLTEAILGHELQVASSPGSDALARALRLAPDRSEIVARLHPDDLALMQDAGEVHSSEISLVGDPSIERGGCVLTAGGATVDAQISAALQRVRAELCGDTPSEQESSP